MAPEFRLDAIEFAGPLELLLGLVRRNEMDPARINLSLICDQFIAYVNENKLAELEEGYAFLVLAGTLLEIKSRALLPAPPKDAEGEGDEFLDEVERADGGQVFASFRLIAAEFEKRLKEMSRFVPGGFHKEIEDRLIVSFDELSLYDLMTTFQRVLSERRAEGVTLEHESRPIEEVIEELLEDQVLLSSGRKLHEMLYAQPTVMDLVTMFLAVLELIAQGRLDFRAEGGEVLIVGA